MGERLTLNEDIKHAKEVADMNYNDAEKFDSNDSAENYIKANCMKCAEEHEQLAKWLEELKSYKNLEEQGLLVRLPCKVGTEVFCYFPGDSHYTKCQIKKIEICQSIFGNICYFAESVAQRGRCCRYYDNEFGKFLFLTREEAKKKKLEEMKK
jgi:hypothetical protein|nr:MAG TPA: hypothetical protein [Caudoviricetes sp.]